MSSSTNDATATPYYYVPVSQAQQPLLPGTRVVVLDERKKRRRCMGISGCGLLVLLGLLLFFLVPRRPRVRYEYSVFNVATGSGGTSVTLTQLFNYYNPNFYAVEWKNLRVNVNDRATGLLIGYGTHNETFQVSALQTKGLNVDIDIVASASEIKSIVLNECFAQGHVTFVSTGTVEAKIWSQSLGTINVGPFIEIILCSS